MRSFLGKAIVRFNYFWDKTPKKTQQQQMQDYIQNSKNLSYIVENIKKQNQNKAKILPPQSDEHKGKLTVVMQLDEVLSYTFTPDEEGYLLSPLRKHDFYYEYEDYDALLTIYKRKNLDNFLNYISEECEPVLWSTGVKSYVDIILGFIDPSKKIPHIITQKQCDLVEVEEEQINVFVKDLSLLGRDMSRVVYLDSKPLSYWMYPDNCYPMQEFRADMTMQTQDMNEIILMLQNLKKSKDVREVFKERFNLREYMAEAKLL